MTLIDQFTSAHNAMVSNKFPVNARVLLYTLIGEWNRQRRPGTFSLTYASMADLSGIPLGSIAKSLKFLKDRNIVKIHKAAGGLIDLQLTVVGEYLLKIKPVVTEKKTCISHARKTPEIQETEGAREAEPAVAKIENRTDGKYAHMNLAQMRAARKAELSRKEATANDGA